METINVSVQYLATGASTEIDIPKCCPRCGVANNPTTKVVGVYSNIYAFTHFCPACNKYHFSMQAIRVSSGGRNEMLIVYPQYSSSKLPTIVSERFQRFAKMYSDAEQAEQNGAIDLSGIGYRASLEILIKDYALEFELDSKEKIAKLDLNGAIAHYFKDNNPIFNTAEVVRILGNDYAHWEQVETVGIETMKAYLDIFISFIKTQLMMKYPPVSR